MTVHKVGTREGNGRKYRLCYDGAIYLRKPYRFVGFINEKIDIEKGMTLRGKELDNYISNKLNNNALASSNPRT